MPHYGPSDPAGRGQTIRGAFPGGGEKRGSHMRSLFEPRSIGGGKMQVIGCSPGCLLVSLLASIVLTVLLNLLINWF